MSRCITIYGAVIKSHRAKLLYVSFCPLLCGKMLDVDNHLLKVHAHQLLLQLVHERCTNVHMQGSERLSFCQVCVPEADDKAERQLSHEKAVEPSKRELDELQIFIGEVVMQILAHSIHNSFELIHTPLYFRLIGRVVILNEVDQLCHAVICISFNITKDRCIWKPHVFVYFDYFFCYYTTVIFRYRFHLSLRIGVIRPCKLAPYPFFSCQNTSQPLFVCFG
mmetsp:Transcript_20219/g.51669  ORF Transcript_20219/g.51669 Transcript_20219/m.51669 type:complete len:222 (-) Transcript_20219:993-1658(-)